MCKLECFRMEFPEYPPLSINISERYCMDFSFEFSGPIVFLWLALLVLAIASWWKLFEKAGKPGWAAIVPIYNIVVFLEIIEKPVWWIILYIIPLVGVVFVILSYVELAKKFGKDVGFAVGLILLGIVFLPMLAFGDAQYQGDGSV